MAPINVIVNLTTIGGVLIILALVAIQDLKSKLNKAFILFTGSALATVTMHFISEIHYSYSYILTYSHITLFLANLIPYTFYIFTLAFIGRKKIFTPLTIGLLIATLAVASIALTPYMVRELVWTPYGVNIKKAEPLFVLTLFNFLGMFAYCFYHLYKFRKTADKVIKSQINMIVYVVSIIIVINMVTQVVLPIFHESNYGNVLGDPSIVLFIAGMGYSILRHKLFDIRTIVLRTLGFVSTIIAIYLIFGLLIFLGSRLLFPGLNLTPYQYIYFILTSIILAFLFFPLQAVIKKLTKRIFYQDDYDSDVLVNNISKILASEIRLGPMTKLISDALVSQMHIQGVDIIVLDKENIYLESGGYYQTTLAELSKDLQLVDRPVVKTDDLDVGPLKNMLKKYSVSLAAQLNVQQKRAGYLLFSNKLRGINYTKKDLLVASIISDELAIAIQNSLAYEQIRLFNASLQKKVEESTTQLLIANDELKKANSTKDDFISMVSHQLGTPLTVMEGFLSLIINGFYKGDQTKIDESLKKALSRTRVMKNLVFDLLNISRMSAGKFFLDISAVNLNEVVEDETSQLEVEAKDKNVQLTYHAPSTPVPILQLDEAKTRQAIMNLINNAIFYSHDGKVDVYLSVDQTNVTVKVVDNGIGVPDNQKDKLFTKFFRADNAVRESPNGTGIGLYLVKRVVEDQHGKIIFSSKVNEGSTFGFSLPITENDKI